MLKGHLGFKGESSTIDISEKVDGVQTITVSDYRGTQTTTIEDGELTGSMVIDNLTSDTTNRPLSAKQGKVLNTNIGNLSDLDTTDKTSLVNAVNSVVESGSNSRGNYVKYLDGTLIQYGRYIDTYPIDIELSAVYRGDQKTITFPIAFIDTNFKMTLSAIAPVNSTYLVDEKTTNTMKFYPIAYASRSSDSYSVDFMAIGRWK